jgi:hypothetical protein
MHWILDTLFANAVPDIFGILFTVPAVALYIRGSTKKRFCASCQRPVSHTPRRATKPATNVGGLIILEGE